MGQPVTPSTMTMFRKLGPITATAVRASSMKGKAIMTLTRFVMTESRLSPVVAVRPAPGGTPMTTEMMTDAAPVAREIRDP